MIDNRKITRLNEAKKHLKLTLSLLQSAAIIYLLAR